MVKRYAQFGSISHGTMRAEDGLKVSDTGDVPRGYSGEVLHVNDHGNATLYNYVNGRAYEVWGIV